MTLRTSRSAVCGAPFKVLISAILAVFGLLGCAPENNGAETAALGVDHQALTPVVQINCGGGAVAPFLSDRNFSGGTTHSTGAAITTSGVLNAAPAGVYQSERYGNIAYTFSALPAGAAYTVRLHFAEIAFTQAGRRVFNVAVNGTQVLTNFDIVAAAGAAYKAHVRDIATNANGSGQIVVQYTSVVDNAKASGIELLSDTGTPTNQAPTVATAASANPNPVTGSTSTLSVLGADDAGEAGLTYTWSVTGTPPGTVTFSANQTNAAKSTTATFSAPGNYALLATIRDAGGLTATSNVAVTVSNPPGTAAFRINAGGGAVAPFTSDQYFSGGTTWSTGATINTSGVANAAPAGVYQSERYGNFTYTFPTLSPGAPYTVRLHFAENAFTQAGRRVFHVAVNGTQVLTNFDIFAAAGANNKAHVRDIAVSANASGQIVVQYTSVVDNAKASGIEIIGAGSGGGTPPTVATAAAASPNPVTAKTSALSVLGADDGGEANLTYSWAPTGSPPGSVSFSANGTNASKSTTATFGAAGTYALAVTIRDATNRTVTSNVSVTVNQTLTTLAVSPNSASVQVGTTRQFSASAADQFGNGMTAPSLSWTVSGGGSINASGLFTAGSSAGGPFVVTATGGGKSGTANVTVTAAPPPGSRLLLRADPTKRFLVGGDGQPFLVNGEGAWTLNSQINVAAQNNYLDTRSSQGLNAFGLQLISRYQDNSPNDYDGVAPFTTPNDFATFNPAYFQRAADLVSRAAQRGMVAFIAPSWAGYDGGQGFYNAMISNGATKVRNYGAAVANTFKDLDNVVWIMGGDKPAPVGSTAIFDALTEGIRSVDTRHMVTSHWNFAPGDSPSGNWVDMVTTYDWNGGVQYGQIRNEWDENDAPVILIEALYERNTQYGATTKILRLQTLHALLFGAKGSFFGHEGVWHLGATTNLPSQSRGHPYDLNSIGIQHQQKIFALFASRAWQDLVPDLTSQLVTSGRGSYGNVNYVSAAKTPNGRLSMICLPNGGTIGVNLARVTLPATATWHDPTSGATVAGGSYTTAETRNFTAPGNNAGGDTDWVLVIQSN
jgi:hypothetical protein